MSKLINGQIVTAWDADHEPVVGRLTGINEDAGTAIVIPVVQSPVAVKLDTCKAFDVPEHPRAIANRKQAEVLVKADKAAAKKAEKAK